MKILLDENVHEGIKKDFDSFFKVFSVKDMKWKGKENGELLKAMLETHFEALITGDKSMQHQQNFNKYPIPVILLNTRFLVYTSIKPLIPEIIEILKNKPKNGVIKVPQ